jgi:hypothetical protein
MELHASQATKQIYFKITRPDFCFWIITRQKKNESCGTLKEQCMYFSPAI